MLYNVGLIHFAVCFDSEEHRAKITLTCIFLLWRLNVLFFPPLSSISQYSAKLAHLAPSVWWWKRLLRVMWCFWCWSTPGRSFERPKLRSKSTILMSVFMAPGSSNWCWYANSDCKKKKKEKKEKESLLYGQTSKQPSVSVFSRQTDQVIYESMDGWLMHHTIIYFFEATKLSVALNISKAVLS